MSKEKLLLSKNIIEILDGDAILDNLNGVEYRMPYLSGPIICEIGKSLGADMEYPWKYALARWNYMQELITHCYQNNQISKLFKLLFNRTQFTNYKTKINTNGNISIDDYRKKVIDLVIKDINDILEISNCSLQIINDEYILKSLKDIHPNVDELKKIDNDYIQSIVTRAIDDISNNNLDSAITKARTMLEEIFCYVIENEKETPVDNGKIDDLYKQVKQILNMNTNPNLDSRINGLLSALTQIVNQIGRMRNVSSDSHGVGSARFKINSHHAMLCVNSAMVVGEFILSTYKHKKDINSK